MCKFSGFTGERLNWRGREREQEGERRNEREREGAKEREGGSERER